MIDSILDKVAGKSPIVLMAIIIPALIGWLMNLLDLFGMFSASEVTLLGVARIAGVAYPLLGVLLGWFA